MLGNGIKYRIIINYDTGDSYHQENNLIESVFSCGNEFQVSNLEIAKQNLKRLEEHHIFYLEVKDFGRLHFTKAEINQKEKEIMQKDWCVKTHWEYMIYLLNDDNEKVECNCFWHGYFERLNSIELEIVNPSFKISF